MMTAPQLVIAMFQQAAELERKVDDNLPDEEWEPLQNRATEAQNAAFEAAKLLGWDWEEVNDGRFAMWCLKATNQEILQEGIKVFSEWAKKEEENAA